MTGPGDVEWLDDDAVGEPQETEELAAGSRRPPLRRRTRILLGVLVVALLGTTVTVAVVTGDDGREQAAPTRTVAPIRSSERTFALELPSRPPAPALAAIRAAFPKAELFGFSAALAAGTQRDVFRFYNATVAGRVLTITVGPDRGTEPDAVLRTATTLELAQALGTQRVRVMLRVTKGAPTARDFAAVQRLVQDARLLATA